MITVNDQWAWVLIWLGAAGIWCYFTGPYRRYRVDLLRDRLFRVRDELFQDALAAGSRGVKDPFAEKAYGINRLTINGMIHFAHEISIVDILFSWISFQRMNPDEKRILTRVSEARKVALDSIKDEEFRDHIECSLWMANLHVVGHVLNTSLVLGVFWHPIKWFVMLLAPVVGRVQAIRAFYKDFQDQLQTQAVGHEAIQQLDAEAELYASSAGRVYAKIL